MAYQFTFEEHEGVVKVIVTGERISGEKIKLAEEAWEKVAQFCMHKGLSRILIISQVTGNLPPLDAYQISTNLENLGLRKNWKIAFVNQDLESLTDIQFAEIVAQNRGINARMFNQEAEAWTWISS